MVPTSRRGKDSLSFPGARSDHQGALGELCSQLSFSLARLRILQESPCFCQPVPPGPSPASSLHPALHSCPFSSDPTFTSSLIPFNFHTSVQLGPGVHPYSLLLPTQHYSSLGIRNLISVKVLALHRPRSWAWMVAQWLKGHPRGPFFMPTTHSMPRNPEPFLVVTSSHPRHDDSLNVPKDAVPAFRFLRRTLGQLGPQVAGPHVWSHPPLPHSAQVLADVIHHLFPYKGGRETRLMSPGQAWVCVPVPLESGLRNLLKEEAGSWVGGGPSPSKGRVFRIREKKSTRE